MTAVLRSNALAPGDAVGGVWALSHLVQTHCIAPALAAAAEHAARGVNVYSAQQLAELARLLAQHDVKGTGTSFLRPGDLETQLIISYLEPPTTWLLTVCA
jgi:hypothetical protein